MKTLLLHHGDCLRHHPGTRHPERPDRVRTILSAIRSMQGTEILPAPKASLEQMIKPHPGQAREESANVEKLLWGPTAVKLDAAGRIYIVDSCRHRVQVYQKVPAEARQTGKM